MLSVRELRLQTTEKILCYSLNFTIKPGEFWIILGENGCGKSTLLHTISRLRMSCKGTIKLQEIHIENIPQPILAQHVGILLQEENLDFTGTVKEYILLGRYPYKKTLATWSHTDYVIVNQILEDHLLKPLANRLFNTLSGGERQRVRIAQLIAQSPQYFLLDEPLQHLDLRYQFQVMTMFQRITKQNCAVAMVLHDINLLQYFGDHVLMIFSNGHVLIGSKETILTESNLEKLYQYPISRFKDYFNIQI